MTLILHEYAASGNCYKIRLTAAHLGVPIERREYDVMTGATRTPEFLATINANGRIVLSSLQENGKTGVLLSSGRSGADPRGSVRPRRHAALDVLGAV